MRAMSPSRAALLALPVVVLVGIACSSSSGGSSSSSGGPASDASVASDAATPDDGGAASDAAASVDAARDALGPVADAGSVNGCAIRTTKVGAECGDVCGVHLQLLGAAGFYCTQDCEDAAGCASAPALTCAPYGACVPRCTGDAECKAQGFKRCDTTAPGGGACDTL